MEFKSFWKPMHDLSTINFKVKQSREETTMELVKCIMVINFLGSIWGKGELKQHTKPLNEHCKENSWDPHFILFL